MSKVRKVNVEGGALYEVTEYDGKYWASKITVTTLHTSREGIGSARSLEDVYSLIKSHSGRQIRSVS